MSSASQPALDFLNHARSNQVGQNASPDPRGLGGKGSAQTHPGLLTRSALWLWVSFHFLVCDSYGDTAMGDVGVYLAPAWTLPPLSYLRMGEGWPGCGLTGPQRSDVQGEQTVAGQPCGWRVPRGWLCGSHLPAERKITEISILRAQERNGVSS
jgi:hypothetical protein